MSTKRMRVARVKDQDAMKDRSLVGNDAAMAASLWVCVLWRGEESNGAATHRAQEVWDQISRIFKRYSDLRSTSVNSDSVKNFTKIKK